MPDKTWPTSVVLPRDKPDDKLVPRKHLWSAPHVIATTVDADAHLESVTDTDTSKGFSF